MKRIYIADSENQELVNYFSQNDKFEVVGSSSDGEVVVNEVVKLKPDVLVMEVMKDMDLDFLIPFRNTLNEAYDPN